MGQTSETLFDNMPCPECGSQHLIQNIKQSEDVYVSESGDIDSIAPRDSIDVQSLMCPKCDKTIWEA